MKLKILWITMKAINRTNIQQSELEKIFANKATEKGLISKIQKQCRQHLTNTNKHPMQKWPKELNRHFSNEEIQKVNKHMKNVLTILKYYRNANQNYSEVSLHTRQKSESESCSVVSDSLRPHGLYGPGNSPGQIAGVGSLSLLQGIFPAQESNPGLLHCR